ncbi:MAG: FAD-linked oxidase C-terminal domain-containing protein [Pirellulales bacterium]
MLPTPASTRSNRWGSSSPHALRRRRHRRNGGPVWRADHPRGSATSLSGQSIGRGLVLDFSAHFNQILAIDPEQRTARVQPGVVLDQLNAAAAKQGLQFADVATSNRANVGGMIGNNSAGARSIRHGKTVDHVIELAVVLADGSTATLGPLDAAGLANAKSRPGIAGHAHAEVERIVRENRDAIIAHFPRVLRRVSGYNLDEFVPECRQFVAAPPSVAAIRARETEQFPDGAFNLAKLVVGAEGTLVVVTEALVHLVPVPAHRGLMVLEFASLTAAIDALASLYEHDPTAIELLDGQIVRMARASLEYRNYLDFVRGDPESLMLVEYSGDTQGEVNQRIAAAESALAGRPGLTNHQAVVAPEAVAHVWSCRKAALPLLMGIPGRRKPLAFVEDTAVDPHRLPEFVARFRQIMRDAGTDGTFYGHASVGCLHIRPMLDTRDREDVARLERIMADVFALVEEFGGSMSGEHGDGLARSHLNSALFGEQVYRAFCEVKAAFDPAGILNPGKVVHGPPPTENLRHQPDEHAWSPPTVLDFSRDGDMAGAAALCNGAGVCRKRLSGTMCPSFMATGEEEHSTRGRANALRRVMTGAAPRESFTSQPMYDTFALCLQCKACKAECPSSVDVAKLKSEFLHKYHGAHGVPLLSRLLGNVGTLNRWGAALAPVSNWPVHVPGVRWLVEKSLGIDRRRSLPRFVHESFPRWFARHKRPTRPAPRGPVVLLDDCLNNYCEPAVNRAAAQVLEAAGYQVHRAGLVCCGRPLISKGLLDEAQQLAERNVAQLLRWVDDGILIVGCEPSCVSALVDDYPDLVPAPLRTDAARLAESVRLIDAHLTSEADKLPLREGLGDAPGELLLHPHCHQRALFGAAATEKLLRDLAGYHVRTLDAGCCGMAGSFGFEHYDVSMAVGQRALFPAVNGAPQAAIAATGFSCRHQIADGTGRAARHPIEFVAERLSDPVTRRG